MHVLEHGHDHHHHHQDEQGDISPVVLLQHMVEHNHNHLHELEEVAEKLDEEVRAKMAPAIAAIHEGNEKLAAILAEMKEK